MLVTCECQTTRRSAIDLLYSVDSSGETALPDCGVDRSMKYRRTVTRSCEVCRKTFFPRADYVRRGKGRFCSQECFAEQRARDKITTAEKRRRSRVKLKQIVISHYGGSCRCCGEAGIEFLTIDHVDGNGAEHRKEIGVRGRAIYRWLRQNGYPGGFQVLCFNCNIARHWNGGVCPHQLRNGHDSVSGVASGHGT